jgi:hypothetical protein
LGTSTYARCTARARVSSAAGNRPVRILRGERMWFAVDVFYGVLIGVAGTVASFFGPPPHSGGGGV